MERFLRALSHETKIKILNELYIDLVWYTGRDDQMAVETSQMIALLETCF